MGHVLRRAIPLCIALTALLLAGCGGGAASPSQVAQAAGATSCDNSGYYIQSKITNEKEVIYDCRFPASLPKCVTYSGNIASNATLEVQLLFSDNIGSQGKPRCLAEYRSAKARAARRIALKREGAYETALNRDAGAAWHHGYTAVYAGLGKYQLPNVYWKWLSPGTYSCSAYETSCWKIRVITRNGCPSSLSVELGEYDAGTKVGTAYGEGGSVDPRTPVDVELDADTNASQGRIESITCF